MLRDLGASYRVQNRDLPGSPDIANRRQHWAIFVHGCFWHAHVKCRYATIPKRNRKFWELKFAANRARDRRVVNELRARGFDVAVVWSCELKDQRHTVFCRLQRLLHHTRGNLDS